MRLGCPEGTQPLEGSLAELAELAVLIVMSLILLSRGIFRPTRAGLPKKRAGAGTM